MRPVFEKTPLSRWESFHCEVVRGDSYNAAWHFHPEYQITLVIKSCGYRLVGDNIAPLHPGDLVLVGSNLPHVWQQESPSRPDPVQSVHAVIVRFLETFAGKDFLEIPEMKPVRHLLRRSSRGLQITGKVGRVVADKMQRLVEATGMERISGLLSILNALAQSDELKPIASAGFVPVLNGSDHDRMERVCDYINTHLGEDIDRAAVAQKAHLSEGAFSRFFKLRTGKTLPQYINELRVGRACRLLAEGEAKVTDIAMECGFTNLANFNRRFREIAGQPPNDYRRRFRNR